MSNTLPKLKEINKFLDVRYEEELKHHQALWVSDLNTGSTS